MHCSSYCALFLSIVNVVLRNNILSMSSGSESLPCSEIRSLVGRNLSHLVAAVGSDRWR